MLAISTLYVEGGGFRGEGRRADDDAGYANEVRYIGCIEITDRDLRDGGMEKELVLREGDVTGFL